MENTLKQTTKPKKKFKRKKNFKKSKFTEKLININRVSKVTKGGKNLRFRAIVVVGTKKGNVGVGVAKANDVANAVKKAKVNGKKNLINFPLTKSLTIPHDAVGDFGACQIIIKPTPEGSGVTAGGAVRTVLEVAGVKNVSAKQLGGNNLLNNARATILALNHLTTKSEVLKKRGIVPKK